MKEIIYLLFLFKIVSSTALFELKHGELDLSHVIPPTASIHADYVTNFVFNALNVVKYKKIILCQFAGSLGIAYRNHDLCILTIGPDNFLNNFLLSPPRAPPQHSS